MRATKRMTRRRFLARAAAAAAGLTVLGLGAQCGGTPEPTATTAPVAKATEAPQPTKAPEAKKEVSIRFASRAGPAGEYHRHFAEEFSKMDNGIVVKTEDVPYAEYKNQTELMAASGTLQDMTFGHARWSYYNAYKGNYLYLDDLAKAAGSDLSRFWQSMLDQIYFEGELMGLPGPCAPGNTSLIAYNIDLLDKYGLPEPEPDWLWEVEFLENAVKAAHPDEGIFAMNLTPSYAGMYGFVNNYDGALMSEDGKTSLITKDANADSGLKFATSLRLEHHVMPQRAELVEGGSTKMFGSGLLVYIIGGASGPVNWVKTVGDKFRWGAHLAPIGGSGERRCTVGGNWYHIYAKSEYPEETFAFMDYLTQPEVGVWVTVNTGKQPESTKAAWHDPRVWEAMPVFKEFVEMLDTTPYINYRIPWNFRAYEFEDVWAAEYELVDYGDKSWDEQAPVVQEKSQEIIDLPRP